MAPAGLLLLPGIDGTGRLFHRLQGALAGNMSVRNLVYPTDVPLGYEALIERVLSEIGDEPLVVLGESFSGPIAIEVAARRPRQVIGLILAATFVTSPVLPFIARIGARLNLQWFPGSVLRTFLIGPWRDEHLAEEIKALQAQLPQEVIAMRLREVAGVDARPALKAVTCPVLVLHGASDRLVRPSEARYSAAVNPRAEVRYLAGPHTVLQCCAAAAAVEINAFFNQCVAAAASRE